MKIKKLASVATLALAALVSPLAASAAPEGNIWEIHRVDEDGNYVEASETPLVAGSTARFVVRLMPTTPATGYDNRFVPVYMGLLNIGSLSGETLKDILSALNPFQIGIYVSGVRTTARMEKFILREDLSGNKTFTDLIFAYEVKAGDFAKPILFADADGQVMSKNKENTSGYWIDPASASTWKIQNYKADGTTPDQQANFQFYTGTLRPKAHEGERITAYDLSLLKFNIQTVDFAGRDDGEQWDVKDEDGNPVYWREVAAGSPASSLSKQGRKIALKPVGVPEKAVDLYVWTENQDTSGLKVKATPGYENREVKPGVYRNVRKITVQQGVSEADAYAILLEGSTEGRTDSLVLSAFDHYTSGDGTGVYLTDYLTIPVKCGAPEASAIMVTVGDTPIVADENYRSFKTTIKVKPTGIPFGEKSYKVKLEPSFSDGHAGDWKDYVHLSLTSGPNDWASVDDFELEFAAGDASEKVVYVYALGGDGHTSGAGHYLEFKPTIADADASAYYTSRGGLKSALLNVDAILPSISSPADGTALSEKAKADVPYTIQLKVSDTYANLSADAGYAISYKCKSTDPDWIALDGAYKIDSNGYLKKDGKGPAFVFPASKVGTCNMNVMVTAPSGYSSSETYTLTVDVASPDSVTAFANREDRTYQEYSDPDAEVDLSVVSVTNVVLSAPYDKTLYAFFKSDDPEVMKRVDGRNIAKDGGQSDLAIIGGQLSSGNAVGQFNVLDGQYTLALDIVLCETKTWDPAKVVSSYKSEPFTVYAQNVAPKVYHVSLGADDFYYADKGGTMPTKLPLGAKRNLTITPADCDFDIAHEKDGVKTFQTYVKIKGSDGDFVEYTGDTVIRGNPEEHPIEYEFSSLGMTEITIKMMDKDMTKFGEEYKFYVEVTDQPNISVEDMSFDENVMETAKTVEEMPKLVIRLSATAKIDLQVGIKLEPRDPSDPGVLKLDADVSTVPGWDYVVTIPKNRPELKLDIDELDGTVGSQKGWNVTAKVLNPEINPTSGTSWSDYYDAVPGRIQVKNVEPKFQCSLGVIGLNEASTNVIAATIGGNENVTWSVSDIPKDMEGQIHVRWYNVDDGGYKDEVLVTEAGKVYTYVPVFASSGTKKVTCYVWDKDMGAVKCEYTWTFEVAPAKTMKLTSFGPAGGGTSQSANYRSAFGRGEGHAVAISTLSVLRNWSSQWRCGNAKTVDVFGWGYKLGAPEDNGTLNGGGDYDIAIDTSGAGPVTADFYTYADDKGRDSFLYAWLVETTGDSSSSEGATVTIAPETYDPADTSANRGDVKTVLMPSDQSDTGEYGEVLVDAVFSREKYPSDNLGDINQDGIPDFYFKSYKFGLVDDSGALSGDDQTDLKAYNEDLDFLPGTPNAAYAAFIPGLAGTWVETGIPFDAQWEIRGYGADAFALNDAPIQLGYSHVVPDRVYTNPRVDSKSTLSYVEWLAWSEFKAAHPDKTEKDWSPERPTDPTTADTDGDGMPDGYEYFMWYRAHVGYLENGVHKYLTGRRYDPRNPGEGQRISSATIAYLFDPRSDLTPVDSPDSSFATDVDTRDTDNDGIPDLIEFEIGTNPFDFDTDGDGLPDGYELCIAGSNPLLATSYTHGIHDALRNFDGDAMAISSYQLEANVLPTVYNAEHAKRWTFAVIAPNGDTDGVQWYAMRTEPAVEVSEKLSVAAGAWWKVTIPGDKHVYAVVSATEPPTAGEDDDRRLALASRAWTVETDGEGNLVRGYPVTLEAGVSAAVEVSDATLNVLKISASIPVEEANAAWIYGRGSAAALKGDVAETAAEYGCLALGRQLALEVPENQGENDERAVVVCALPSDERDVAFLHYLCYQEFGFDPRTAWSSVDPLGARWSPSAAGDDQGMSGDSIARGSGGYAYRPTRTRDFTAYDEFLLYSFFVNNGVDMGSGIAYREDDPYSSMVRTWGIYTTNPMGPGEVINADSNNREDTEFYWGRDSDQGADTDGDGVPDGWELYVMAGPKTMDGAYVFAPPYAGFATCATLFRNVAPTKASHWSPFVPDAGKVETCLPDYTNPLGGVIDSLTELREFSGTDSCAYYAKDRYTDGESGSAKAYSTTILRREDQDGTKGVYGADDSKWLNKFFPTDPWNNDTDGDGIVDAAEGQSITRAGFVYGTPADDGKIWSIPGGGLNPCSVDTDLDGLPDGWEYQYQGSSASLYGKGMAREQASSDPAVKAVYLKDENGTLQGNALQGLTNGMDGTVPDAYNVCPPMPDIASVLREQNKTMTDGTNTTWRFYYTRKSADGRLWSNMVDRDYDHDGLDNFQEYLVGAMRCWRYDDPISPWDTSCFNTDMYCKKDDKGVWTFDLATAVRNFYAAGYLENDPDGTPGGEDEEGEETGTGFSSLMAEGEEEGEEEEPPLNPDAVNEFWGKTLVDASSPIYNPFLAMSENGSTVSMSPGAQYFSPVVNGWDIAYDDPSFGEGHQTAMYLFYHRIGETPVAEVWGEKNPGKAAKKAPTKYIGCSPLKADTDNDGLDDYYELFHGLNPLLGESGKADASGNPCDIVFDGWTDGVEAWGTGDAANFWQTDEDTLAKARGNKDPVTGMPMDFVTYPWLNGLRMADPDGDDIRNAEEGIMPKLATTTWHHTDPTPLWMTDASYTNSLVTRFFRLPTRFAPLSFDDVGDSFEYKGATYYFCDLPGYYFQPMGQPTKYLNAYKPDMWSLAAKGKNNWVCSFEQNEGYDTDHNALPDGEETSGRFRTASDPLDADSPRRRQAMYFQGEARKSVLQTMPFSRERHPGAAYHYPDELAFLTYTVECWVKPEVVDRDSTVIERAIWTGASAAADRELLRRNFMIGIKDGQWYTKFDSSGTLESSVVEVIAKAAAVKDRWTHVAATFDGKSLDLYVDGVVQEPTYSNTQPEYGASALSFFGEKLWASDSSRVGWTGDDSPDQGGLHWVSAYDYNAIIVGASAKGRIEAGDKGYETLDLCNGVEPVWNAEGKADAYKNYFQGYVDEIRIWDGARTEEEIRGAMNVRFTREMALENRSAVYAKWKKGMRRYAKDENGKDYELPAELRYHFSFDSVPGAVDAETVATSPHGFCYRSEASADAPLVDGKAWYSRPETYTVGWFEKALQRYPGTVYANPAYVTWIPNTVTHMPRYDGTTLDSRFWSHDFCGATNGVYTFANTCEPVSLWTQFVRNGASGEGDYCTTASRHFFVNKYWYDNPDSTQWAQFEFTGRYLNQQGDDLVPLGGAFVKYCADMWDGDGASTTWEVSRNDSDNDGMSDGLEEYIRNNYFDGATDASLNWDTRIDFFGSGLLITAGEAYRRLLAQGVVESAAGSEAGDGIEIRPEFAQTADTTGSRIPDWWEDLYNIVGVPGTTDTDNDGLNNRAEYLVSEVFTNMNIRLNPVMTATDTLTNDYFRTFGKLYLGEMFTDFDQVEDHWERDIADTDFADANVWDALKDHDADGWTNFDEARYNSYSMSTLAQLVSHAMGDAEVLDAPTPTIKLVVRYNGKRALASGETGDGKKEDNDSSGGDDNSADVNIGNANVANLVVQTFTDPYMEKADATYDIKPGKSVSSAVYLGSWENRVVRGTMSPGHIDLGSVNIKFAQVLRSDLYSWSDENGLHVSGTYEEFKAALEKNPNVVQNFQKFEWRGLEAFGGAEAAVTVSREKNLQIGYIQVYGEKVGTIDLETGDFEFDMNAMNNLTPNYTFSTSKDYAWGYKEAIFKLTYSAVVPSVQQDRYQVSLARPDSGIVKGGKNSIMAYYDLDGDGYTPGTDPIGILRDVTVGWAGTTAEIELSEMNAVTPRIDLWAAASSDRAVRTEMAKGDDGDNASRGPGEEEVSTNKLAQAPAGAVETRVRVLRYQVDNFEPFMAGTRAPRVIFDRVFQQDVRSFIHEGDFLAGDKFDIDWDYLAPDVVDNQGVIAAGGVVTNVNYLVLFGDGKVDFDTVTDKNGSQLTVHPLMISRRFERTRTAPTAVQESAVCTTARPTFSWKIENEDIWASRYGTTYTAFKVKVWNANDQEVYDSGYQRMPAADANGVYSWTAPLYADEPSPTGTHLKFANLANYKWQVFTYNAKFKSDSAGSAKLTMRLNVTTADNSTFELPVKLVYAGPAKTLAGRVHVQAFTTPDFVGEPVAERVLDTANAERVVIRGLREGTYFVRAYIDTDRDFRHSDWESWGYLNGRDVACVGGDANIFKSVAVKVGNGLSIENLRTLYIEDCDTNGNMYPDVWEAEDNRGRFDPNRIPPVSGDAELIRFNPNLLKSGLTEEKQLGQIANMVAALNSVNGVAMMTGVSPADVVQTAGGFEIKSEVDPETLTIVGLNVDAAQNRVLLKVGAETTANVDSAVANFLNVTVRKGAEVSVKVEHAEFPVGPWKVLQGVGGTVTVDRAGAEIEVKLDGELPAQGFFRAKVEE